MASSATDHDHLFKLLLIGDTGVGKSSILLRFTDDVFDERLASTIGVDFKLKMLDIRSKRVKLTIWDTAGQERFRTLTSSYYRGAHGILFVYDVTRRETFTNLQHWLKEVEMYCPGGGKGVVKLLVGNKVDMVDRVVTEEDGEAWARAKGMLFLEASAKTKQGIEQVFEEVAYKIMDNPRLVSDTTPASQKRTGDVGLASGDDSADAAAGGCCG